MTIPSSIHIPSARQGGFSTVNLPAPLPLAVGAQAIRFLAQIDDGNQWLFDFVGLGDPAVVTGDITSSGTKTGTVTQGADEGIDHLNAEWSATGSFGIWRLTANDSRIGTLIDESGGSFRLRVEVWKPAGLNIAPGMQINLKSPENGSYAGLGLSDNWPEVRYRNTSGDDSEFDYLINWADFDGLPWGDNAWSVVEAINNDSGLTWTIDGHPAPSTGSKLNLQGADQIELSLFNTTQIQRIRSIELAPF